MSTAARVSRNGGDGTNLDPECFPVTGALQSAAWSLAQDRPNVDRTDREALMILGMSIATFTLVHVVISLVAIAAGLVVLIGMLRSYRLPALTALFLLTTVLTSASGFLFPNSTVTPGQIFGYLSLAVLAVALLALYGLHLNGAWRWIYAGSAIVALYLNTFVLVVQSFAKIPALHALAPTGTEPPFLVAQGLLLAVFVVLGIMAVMRFHPERAAAAHGLDGMRPA
jgi:hypothetical protein